MVDCLDPSGSVGVEQSRSSVEADTKDRLIVAGSVRKSQPFFYRRIIVLRRKIDRCCAADIPYFNGFWPSSLHEIAFQRHSRGMGHF